MKSALQQKDGQLEEAGRLSQQRQGEASEWRQREADLTQLVASLQSSLQAQQRGFLSLQQQCAVLQGDADKYRKIADVRIPYDYKNHIDNHNNNNNNNCDNNKIFK